MVIDIFFGSITWWLMLGAVILEIKQEISEAWIGRIRYFSAIMLGSIGALEHLQLLA